MGSVDVVIFSMYYWPEETGNAPYSAGLAEYLAATGAHVTVYAGMPHYPLWKIFPKYRKKTSVVERINGVEVRRFAHYVPRRPSAIRRALYEISFIAHAAARARRSGVGPDVLLGVVPSLGGPLLAAFFGRRWRLPWGVLVQDLPGQAVKQSGMTAAGWLTAAVDRVERSVLCRADRVGIVSESFRGPLNKMGIPDRRIELVPNWVHVQAPAVGRIETRRTLGWSNDDTVVLHAGNMGLKQELENVIETARLAAHEPRLRFALAGRGHRRAELEKLAAGLRNVQFLEHQPHAAFPALLNAADILLVNQGSGVVDMSFPSKLTSYWASGRPVVAAVSSEGPVAEVARSHDVLVLVPPANPRALLDAILELRNDPTRANELGAAGKRYAEENLSAAALLPRAAAFIERMASDGR